MIIISSHLHQGSAMRLLLAPALFILAALLVLAAGRANSANPPGGQKADKKSKAGKGKNKKGMPVPQPKATPPRKPPTAWEEYLTLAPELSMDIDHFSSQLFRRNGNFDGRPLPAPMVHDARLKKAMSEIAVEKKKGAPKPLSMDDPIYKKGIEKLVEKGLPGAATGDEGKKAEGLFGALMALGALNAQGDATAQKQSEALANQAKSWQAVVEIPKANAGPVTKKPPLKFEVVVGPIRDRSAQMTNVSGQDLRDVTLYLRTGLSPGQEEYFVFIPTWKKGETRQLSRALVLKTMDVANPVPYKNAFKYSVWCPELSIEDVVLHLPNQRPRTAGANYFLCVPEAKKK